MFNSVNLGNFCSQSRKERSAAADFGERAGCAASNLYLPSCTYYVPEFSTVSSFLPQAPSRQISYPYSTNLSQVPPVREVSYGLEPANKWHPRSNYGSCYAAEELMHRECLPPATMTEMLMKSESAYSQHHHHHHPPGSNHPAATGFYSSLNKNSVLPQGFDRFFENAYCSAAENPPEPCLQHKGEPGKLEPPDGQPGADAEDDDEQEEDSTAAAATATSTTATTTTSTLGSSSASASSSSSAASVNKEGSKGSSSSNASR